jgi:SRSO17 transposase
LQAEPPIAPQLIRSLPAAAILARGLMADAGCGPDMAAMAARDELTAPGVASVKREQANSSIWRPGQGPVPAKGRRARGWLIKT